MGFKEVIKHPRFSRLLAIRWSGQTTDGVFQSALASFILFSPNRQANALSAALGFAVVLLPYSIVGPFVGTGILRKARVQFKRTDRDGLEPVATRPTGIIPFPLLGSSLASTT